MPLPFFLLCAVVLSPLSCGSTTGSTTTRRRRPSSPTRKKGDEGKHHHPKKQDRPISFHSETKNHKTKDKTTKQLKHFDVFFSCCEFNQTLFLKETINKHKRTQTTYSLLLSLSWTLLVHVPHTTHVARRKTHNTPFLITIGFIFEFVFNPGFWSHVFSETRQTNKKKTKTHDPSKYLFFLLFCSGPHFARESIGTFKVCQRSFALRQDEGY